MKKLGMVLIISGALLAGFFIYQLSQYDDTVKGRLTSTAFVKSLGIDQTRQTYYLLAGLSIAMTVIGGTLCLPRIRK